MKLGKLAAGMILATALGISATTASALDSYTGDDSFAGGFDDWETIYEDFIQDRLMIGVRATTFRLKNASRPEDWNCEKTFVGYINKLEEEDTTHLYPVVAWWICPYIAIEITYDKVEASTWNFNNHATDGNIEFGGPIFTLRGQYPFWENRVIPFVGIGYADWSCDFKESENWFTRSDGVNRVMELGKADVGWALTAGVGVRPIRHLEIEAMVRQLDAKTDAEFWYMKGGVHRGHVMRTGEFTLDHIAYGLAASYVF